jgi:hypothetical protein
MTTLFTRDDLIDGLRDLVRELKVVGQPTGLRIIGGCALALRHFDRRLTVDVDALRVNPGDEATVARAAQKIAERRGWQDDWLNFEPANLAPEYGRSVHWESIYDDGVTTIEIAPADALLAMKLRANRPGRDTDDIRKLLAICEITSVEAADELYGEFYPGDSLTDRAWGMVERILAAGPLEKPNPPGLVSI